MPSTPAPPTPMAIFCNIHVGEEILGLTDLFKGGKVGGYGENLFFFTFPFLSFFRWDMKAPAEPNPSCRTRNFTSDFFALIISGFIIRDVAVFQWITSCHKNHMTTRVLTLLREYVTSLTTSKIQDTRYKKLYLKSTIKFTTE